ncbi:MAG: hypothetical protein WCJ07_09225 [Verrucomicrobiota bacterium]
MSANLFNGPDCRKCSLAIEWHDCSFCPAITLRRGLAVRRGAPAKHCPDPLFCRILSGAKTLSNP